MYKVVRRTETGEVIILATLDDLNRAKQTLEDFKQHWPGDYSIQESLPHQEIELGGADNTDK